MPHLRAALRSAIDQTYSNIEIVLIDDGSVDGTREILKSESEKDHRIRPIFFNENRGVGEARWRGINESRGEYILFLDSDDLLVKEAVSICVEAIKNGAESIIFGFEHFDSKTQYVLAKHIPEVPNNLALKTIGANLIAPQLSHISHTYWSRMTKATLLRNERAFKTSLPFFEELISFSDVHRSKTRVVIIPKVLYRYRTNREGQATSRWLESRRGLKLACLDRTFREGINLLTDPQSKRILISKIMNIAASDLLRISRSPTCDKWLIFEESYAFRAVLSRVGMIDRLRAVPGCRAWQELVFRLAMSFLPSRVFAWLFFIFAKRGI